MEECSTEELRNLQLYLNTVSLHYQSTMVQTKKHTERHILRSILLSK